MAQLVESHPYNRLRVPESNSPGAILSLGQGY